MISTRNSYQAFFGPLSHSDFQKLGTLGFLKRKTPDGKFLSSTIPLGDDTFQQWITPEQNRTTPLLIKTFNIHSKETQLPKINNHRQIVEAPDQSLLNNSGRSQSRHGNPYENGNNGGY
ncbi:MAG: hypothetical protein VKJ06_04150 [Vampirovibrionales bacterium]|nr:hypothetical protein [Vampirovibrionales bacterium]